MIEVPNFIEVYQNVFDDKFCNEVINFFDQTDKAGFTLNRQDHDGAKKLEKEDEALYLPRTEYPLIHTTTEIMDTFQDKLWNVAYHQYAHKYGILNELSAHKIFSMKIQKTEPSQGYHTWHCESTCREDAVRLLTWTVYLNDDFEAGETEFLYQQYRYKPNKGDIIIFPAAFTHTHRGNPPIGGVKYIITGWVEY